MTHRHKDSRSLTKSAQPMHEARHEDTICPPPSLKGTHSRRTYAGHASELTPFSNKNVHDVVSCKKSAAMARLRNDGARGASPTLALTILVLFAFCARPASAVGSKFLIFLQGIPHRSSESEIAPTLANAHQIRRDFMLFFFFFPLWSIGHAFPFGCIYRHASFSLQLQG